MPPIVAVTGFVVQATATVVTLAVAVPVLLVTVHVCAGFVGCVFTSTSYAPVTFVVNVNGTVPVPVTVSVSVVLSVREEDATGGGGGGTGSYSVSGSVTGLSGSAAAPNRANVNFLLGIMFGTGLVSFRVMRRVRR